MLYHRNKLFLIGNGFDLAHGLETSYKNFIDNFWEAEKTKILSSNQFFPVRDDHSYTYEDDILIIRTPKTISTLPDDYISQNAKGYEWFKCLASNSASSKWTFAGSRSSKVHITLKNRFLQHISEKTYLQNWVDIEAEYYNVLKNSYKIQYENLKGSYYAIEQLNNDFMEIQHYLELYLASLTSNPTTTIPKIMDKFKAVLQPETLNGNNAMHKNDIIMFLNFNYTKTDRDYISYFQNEISQEIKYIHIHGELNDRKNPIIFGYGDELDDYYLKMENTGDNHYLNNVKSIRYLQTPNYTELIKFIESGDYEVFIMGHSCGISDRTLLNTIFESENCRSIKIFYHKIDDDNNDFTDKTMNITRNFKDKPSMRKKVIDETNCEPLI